MWDDVALPVWAVIALSLLAAVAVLDRLLLPSVRWAIRRRANKAIEELNARLKLHIQPFTLTRREVLIDRLLYDPEVAEAVARHAAESGSPPEMALAKAAGYAREIVPAFSAYAYFHIGTKLARRVCEALYRVRLGYANDEALRSVPSDSAVVFVINHRSNIDYILVTYVAAAYSALSYAVGEWAQIWGLRGLIRSMGAYFIRRNSRDPLYRKILARYVDMSTKAGVVQAIFPEGGLSRDGLLKPPKLGLLSYMVAGFVPQGPRDVVFVPVGLNYDRVLEDRVLTEAVVNAGDAPRFRFSPAVLAHFVLNNLWLLLRGAWRRYGYACVSFGHPISLRAWLAQTGTDFRLLAPEARNRAVESLGNDLMLAVGLVVPPLPVALVSTALIESTACPATTFELKGRVYDVIRRVELAGAQVHIPRAERDVAIGAAIELMRSRHLIRGGDDGLATNPAELKLLRFYANSIAHLVGRPGF